MRFTKTSKEQCERATGYRLDVSTSTTFSSYLSGYQNLDVGNVTSRSLSALIAGTTYYYRVRAYNSGGTSGNSGTIKVTTLPNPPSVPTANAASGVTSTGFTANWSSTSGNSSTITVTTSLSAPPTLGRARQGGNLVLAWPTNFSGFTLEFAIDLPASSWTSNPASPAIANGHFVVTNPISDGGKSYGLKQ